jgi:hypothetical protein
LGTTGIEKEGKKCQAGFLLISWSGWPHSLSEFKPDTCDNAVELISAENH